ncbi:MAG: L28 family ribosomal protein [Candidatus Pacebacteria bacterium]|nr:L28 family ribosomal protein [Candidatus Paceibacterota bacterium]
MSNQCTICGKSSQMVWRLKKLRGKFNPTSKRRKLPNLQWVRLASGKRVKACTKCIRTLAKNKKK